ncbi:MAG: SET domain-containing protein-lysine N-methyltransferase [Lewinellaceae bacterium]|nr:SET domain-containing protein-lysine N-methyltransferase [Lewinellaceae bacterium]
MQRLPFLYISDSPLGGRGVFTLDEIPADSLIEICPVIILSGFDMKQIHQTDLHDYYFLWGDEQDQAAIALGYGSLYNHSYHPNAKYLLDYERNTIDIYTIRDIEDGEEITINYNGDPDDPSPVWFHQPNYKR